MLIGFLTGIAANTIGFLMAILIFGNGDSIKSSIDQSIAQGFFGKLVSIGAILNLLVFFWFINRKKDYRARGVILATIVIAIITFLTNFN